MSALLLSVVLAAAGTAERTGSNNGWVLIPLGVAIGALAAAVYVATGFRRRARHLPRS